MVLLFSPAFLFFREMITFDLLEKQECLFFIAMVLWPSG